MKQRCPSREFLDVSEALQSLTQEELLLAIKEATKRYQEMRADTWASFPEELWSLILQQCNRRMVVWTCNLRKKVLSLGCTSKAFNQISDKHCVKNFTKICSISNTFLRKFTNLKQLKIRSEDRISMDYIPTSLQSLTWRGLNRLDISSFPHLQKLCCPYFTLDDLSAVSNLTSLQVQTLAGPLPTPLLTNIRSLQLASLGDQSILESLMLATNLTDLWIDNNYLRCDPLNVTHLTNLTRLSLRCDSASLIQLVRCLPNLQSLKLFKNVPYDVLLALPKLESLELFESYPEITHLTNLTYLDAHEQLVEPRLSNFSRLTCLKGVISITEDLPVSLHKLTSRHWGSHLPISLTNLTSLKISSRNYLGDRFHLWINGLVRLESLTVNLRPEEASLLTNLRNLRKFCCSDTTATYVWKLFPRLELIGSPLRFLENFLRGEYDY